MMAAAADIDTKEIELCIKGLLISRPTVVKANVLQRECEEELGKPFPVRQLGFSTFVDYLKSIPNVVQLEPRSGGYNPDVFPVASKASSHIDQLVSRQRVVPSKRRGVARRGSYGFRPPVAPRRRPCRPVSGPNFSIVAPNQINRLNCLHAQYPHPFPAPWSQPTFYRRDSSVNVNIRKLPSRGINVNDLERDLRRNYHGQDLTRNGIYGVNGPWYHAEQGGSKVNTKHSDRSYKGNGIPAGYEDELDDLYDEGEEQDSEEEMSNKAIQLWSKALGNKEGSYSSRWSEENTVCNSRQETLNKTVEIPEDDSNISRGMVNNFRKILSKNLNGIWASELPKLYYEEFNVPLDLLDLGYTSAISLVSSLPSVFSFKKDGSHDWKVYDAQYITQSSLDAQEGRGNGLSSENERYVPQTIIEKIKKLLEDNPNGFRSTDLLAKYQETFRKPLDLDVLGFNTLDEFLPILENDITLKKVFDYYLLLPKHKILPLEDLQPPKPDERLNSIPAEALCVPIPDNVMRIGDEIPLQELPPLPEDLQDDLSKPLLELEVRVAEVISPVFFYITLDKSYEDLESMMDDLHKYYEWEGSLFQIPLPYFAKNLYCAAKYDGYWHRAQITKIRNDGDIEIEFIDYGTPSAVKTSDLRFLSKEFTSLPVQAICAKLAGLKPLNGETKFPKEVCETFLSLVQGKRLVAHVYNVSSRVRQSQEKMQLDLILYDVENRNEEIVLNDYLVENGLASPLGFQTQDNTAETQLALENVPVNELISHQASSSATPLPLTDFPSIEENDAMPMLINDLSSVHGNGLTSLPGNGTTFSTSSIFTLLKRVLSETSNDTSSPPSPRTCSLPVYPSKNSKEVNKRRGPPPGFKEIYPVPDFDISTPLPMASQIHPANNESSAYMPAEQEKNLFMNNYYLMNPKEFYPELMMQEQYFRQNVYQPNPSNMPLIGAPLLQSPIQNMSRQSLTYGSFNPPPTAYNPPPNMYRQQEYRIAPPIHDNYYTPVPLPGSNNFFVVNRTVPANILLMNNPVPNQYFPIYPSPPTNLIGNLSSKVQNYRPEFSSNPPSVNSIHSKLSQVQDRHTPSPSPNASVTSTPIGVPVVPTTPSSSSSPVPAYTPVTVPEWPPKNVPVSYTNSVSGSKFVSSYQPSVPASILTSELSESQIPRPSTPLTPGSAEVAIICKHSRPNSASSDNRNVNSQNQMTPFDNLQISKSPAENSTNNSQVNTNTSDKATSNFQSEHDSPKTNSDSLLNRQIDNQQGIDVNSIILPPDMDVKEISQTPCSSEKLYSANISPIEYSVSTTPTKEESSDDYVSASENMEEAKQQIVDWTVAEPLKPIVPLDPSEPSGDSNEDIPDSWENLDLDETPAKAENFPVDFSQPLELIIGNINYESSVKSNVPDVVKSTDSPLKNKTSPLPIPAPVNWKDVFDPDSNRCLERFNNNNEVKENSLNLTKFNIKKVPVQKLEIQGKFFHLVNVNNVPAILPLEFFKQFSGISPVVVIKIIEIHHNKIYTISKADYPAILSELERVEFCGGIGKRSIIRFCKVNVMNISEIPECLKVLNAPNKSLLDDLKKIINEFELF